MKNIHCHSNYRAIEKDLMPLVANFDSLGDYVTKGQRNTIKKILINGDEINIKQFKKPHILNGFIYKFIRKSKAKRSFIYAKRLLEAKILTPQPIAYIEETTGLLLKDSYYISQHLSYDFDFRELIHNPKFDDRRNILEQFTEFTFKLHENNIQFLDHSPGNTLIVESSVKNYEFYLIDLNRMKFKTLTYEERMRNFSRLWLSKTMIKIIANKYAELSGRSYEFTHQMMFKYSRAYQKKIDSKKLRRSGRKLVFKN